MVRNLEVNFVLSEYKSVDFRGLYTGFGRSSVSGRIQVLSFVASQPLPRRYALVAPLSEVEQHPTMSLEQWNLIIRRFLVHKD
jgi:hypothetical protein